MKKFIYLTLAILLTGNVAFTQIANVPYPVEKNNEYSKSKVSFTESKDFDDPIWESDFSNADDWDIGNEAGNEDDWVIGTTGSTGPFLIGTINSTTADNGFALFDSDLLCSGNQNAWISTPEITFGDINGVSVQFETYFRDFQGQCFIETSTDGNIWIPLEILDLEVNESTENPILFTTALPSLTGETSGYIRFRYNGGCDYAWMIDDFKVAETPEFDIRLNEAWYDEHILQLVDPDAPVIDYLDNLEYSQYGEGNTRPLTFVGSIENLGTEDMTGVVLVATVTTPNGEETFPSDPIDIPSFSMDTISIPDVVLAAFAEPALGTYTVSFAVAANEAEPDEDNNTVADKSFNVVENITSNDRGDFYQTTGATADDCIYGNQLTYMQPTTVNYVEFGLDDEVVFENLGTLNTIAGEELFVNIRKGSVLEDEGGDNEMELLFEDDELSYIIEEDDISSGGALIWIRVPLGTTLTLDANTVYQSEVQLPPVGSDYALVARTSDQEELAGVLYDFEDPSSGPQGWFTLGTDAPAIRMGFDATLSSTDIEETLNYSMDQNFPNPVANGSTRISWELQESAENVVFRVTDNTGKTILEKDMGDRPAGVQEDIVLDHINFAAGVYQYSLRIGDTKIVRKMIITK